MWAQHLLLLSLINSCSLPMELQCYSSCLKILECFHQKPSFLFNWKKKDMDILDEKGWVNYQETSFKHTHTFLVPHLSVHHAGLQLRLVQQGVITSVGLPGNLSPITSPVIWAAQARDDPTTWQRCKIFFIVH